MLERVAMAGASILKRMDAAAFLGFDAWEFCVRSLFHQYGRQFLGSLLLRHPHRVLTGLRVYRRQIRPSRHIGYTLVGISSWGALPIELSEGRCLVGLGFCQKPLEPRCPSGRPNHRCWLLAHPEVDRHPAGCAQCAIREVATHSLPSGSAIYVMTSASDFARDVLLPSLDHGSSNLVVLSLCPFSVAPMTLALSICGLRGVVLSYGQGNCEDFAAWLRADQGDKREQTCLPPSTHESLIDLLDQVATAKVRKGLIAPCHFREEGNLYTPVT